MEVLGKNYPVRIAAPGNAETGQSCFPSRIFPGSCMDLPEDGALYFPGVTLRIQKFQCQRKAEHFFTDHKNCVCVF